MSYQLLKENIDKFDFLKEHEKAKILKRYLEEKDIYERQPRTCSFVIKGEKIFSAMRPRVGKGSRIYAPDGKNKDLIAKLIKEQIKADYVDFNFFDYSYIEVEIQVYFAIPKLTKYEKVLSLLNIMRHVKKPDVDNIAKIYLDACNGVTWEDDCSITKLTIEKFLSEENEIRIKITYK